MSAEMLLRRSGPRPEKCVTCGKFVAIGAGRSLIVRGEGNCISSVETECVRCSDAREDRA